MKNRILFIVTSHSDMGDSGKKTGIWAEEITQPYAIFTQAGYEVDIYSPKGGKIVFDPSSLKPVGENESSIEAFLSLDRQAQPLAELKDIKPYDAIFVPGGHGAMWDLATDTKVAEILTQANSDHKIIAAVCHGVASLVNAKGENGKPLVNNKTINSFTDDEESAAGLDEVVPFKLESKLRELGGKFEKADKWSAFAVQDANLITGQNPASSILVAETVLKALTSI